MTQIIYRANVEHAKAEIRARLGDPYEYGEMFTGNLEQGTDCSGVWNDTLGWVTGRFQWGREAEGATTESYRYIPVGGVGPFGTIRVASPHDIPADAVAKLAFHHGPGGGANSHMWGELDGMRIESAGSKGLVTAPAAWPIDHPYANAWAYLPGPIVEDGTTPTVIEAPDTLYADVSEWQKPVGDSYPYRVLCIRSNDGTHRDKNWAANYAWTKKACDDGRLAFFIVYLVYRPGVDSVAIHKAMVGDPDPKMAVMVDVESWGGQISGDQSAGINATIDQLAAWLGDRRRVIGYGNVGDLNALWPRKPDGIRLVVAGYGSNPTYPGKIAHQYTDGQGYGGGLPEGAPPFGNCDMNSADGYTATQFAAALGIQTTTTGEDDFMSALTDDEQREMLELLRQQAKYRRPSLSPLHHVGEGNVNTCAGFAWTSDGLIHPVFTGWASEKGHVESIALCLEVAATAEPGRAADAALADTILSDAKAANPSRFTAALAQIEATKPALLQQYLTKKGS